MKFPGDAYPFKVELNNCDREPIHIIGTAQSHGVILVCDKENLIIIQCSENAQNILGYEAEDLLGKTLNFLLSDDKLNKINFNPGIKNLIPGLRFKDLDFVAIAHVSDEYLIVDLEPGNVEDLSINLGEQLSKILGELNSAGTINEITSRAAGLVRSLFDYDRVMVYQFDEAWNGTVVAEEKNEDLESWLGLHYPATDIPAPARAIFLKQEVRIISDVNYKPSIILPANHKPVDLSLSELRGVSPIHIEYLKNMGVGASLTAAIILKGKLWGLLACHNNSPKFINFYHRQTANVLTQICANRLGVIIAENFIQESQRLNHIKEEILTNIRSQAGLIGALIDRTPSLPQLINSGGGAVYFNGELKLIGNTPGEPEVLSLIKDFLKHEGDIFYTRNLSKIYQPAALYKTTASGILSIRAGEIEGDYLIWFRGESATEVSWGGNPEKNGVVEDGIEYLRPRKSFEKWTRLVSGISFPWKDYEIDVAKSLRDGITNILLQRQKEIISLLNSELHIINKDLESFSYSVSHDLRAPLRGISGFAKILQEKYSPGLDEGGKKALNIILNSSREMHGLIEDLLAYSKIGQIYVQKSSVDIHLLVKSILESLNVDTEYPTTVIEIDSNLPKATGDKTLLYQLFLNLISNALKFSANKPNPVVNIGFGMRGNNAEYFVKDNGIGFNPKFEEKVFKVFSRLVGDEFPGTGIGLATVKKVVEKHNGQIRVETSPGAGSCFYFTLENLSKPSN
ncbi:ATP-binding protein [soil metagenome]